MSEQGKEYGSQGDRYDRHNSYDCSSVSETEDDEGDWQVNENGNEVEEEDLEELIPQETSLAVRTRTSDYRWEEKTHVVDDICPA